MTTETRKRIRAYKKMLPELRERVIAVALLLAMSASMLGSASFAWITLSRSPEVSGMSTTVAANGNLEIALAQGSAKDPADPPRESAVGDSSAAEGQNIVGANVTWGNLVNVSDPTYGLSQIKLRPALLSGYNRTEYPLNGATYGGDGRVVTTNDRYKYASYVLVDGSSDRYTFSADSKKVNYGVRAISSVGYENLSGNLRAENFLKDTEQFYMNAQSYYGKIVSGKTNEVNTLDEAAGVTCITALQGLVEVFAQDKINEMGFGYGTSSKTSCSRYIWYLNEMLGRLKTALELEGKAILEMANWQAYMADEGENPNEKTFATIDAVITAKNQNQLASYGVNISTLDSYIDSVNVLDYCINGKGTEADPGLAYMASFCQNPDAPEKDYYWEDIDQYVNKLVDINTATIADKKLSDINGYEDAMGIIGGGKVMVYGGELYDIEKRFVTDDYRVQADVKVKVHIKKSIIDTDFPINGTVYTNAYGYEPEYITDISYSEDLDPSGKGEATAKDTYGLAFDIWVRTNYPNAVLTLEGSAKYEDRPETVEIEGAQYDLYTIKVSEEGVEMELEVYQKDNKWYYVDTMEEVASEQMGSQTPDQKFVQVIVGYEGENRVWEDWRQMLELGYIEQDATTQGAGSCFVFYASPTEQPKIMEMLQSFNVAFIDQDGALLGNAKLNLDSAYANQGKVTVPLEMASGVDFTDDSGDPETGIMTLSQNEPTFITAIVYLNGSDLKNENVLANGELQGQLNIQFGTNSTLVAPENEELQMKSRSITAEVTVNGETITNGTIGGTEGLEYKKEGYPATVTLTVVGDQPERISGFFVRVINDTQGTRGQEVEFTKNADGTWTGNFTLTNPGTYAFNTLLVDGIQYTLHDGTEQSGLNQYYPANRPYVYIQGLKIESVVVGVQPGEHMTAATSMEFPVTVRLDAAVEPKQVSAHFFSDDKTAGNTKQYTAILKYDPINEEWTGSANITSSGTYTLDYISVDGESIGAPSTGTYNLRLGMTASIGTTLRTEDWEFDYIGPSQIEMTARIYDDNHQPIGNIPGVELRYRNIVSAAPMTWNGSYYSGVFDIIQPGELTFQSLKLGEYGTIYSVPNPPKFWAISLEKPVYVSAYNGGTKQTVIKDSLNATMRVELKDAETASIYAQIEHRDADNNVTTYYIPAADSSGNSRTFNLPKLDGIWTMKALLMQNVYDPDYDNGEGSEPGKWYAKPETATNPVVTTTIPEGEHFIMETDQVSTEVIASYNITVTYGGAVKNGAFTEVYGSAETAFMTLHNSKELQVKVSDYAGRPFDGVKSVTWEITHDAATMKTYGGYTGTGVSTNTITMTLKEGSTTEYVAPAQEFRVAGKYTSTITVDMGTDGTIPVTAVPTFTVESSKASSAAPSAKITAAEYASKSGGSSSFTDTSTTVYYKEAEEDACGITYYNYTPAKVTITLSGYGNASGARLEFTTSNSDGKVHLYEYSQRDNGTSTNAYTWTSNGTCERYMGYWKSDTASDDKTPAGTLKATELILTYGGVSYKFDIPDITINNPS